MTLIILAVIFFSAFFRLGWVWLSELALYMHAVLFTAGAAYALRHDAHVRIDNFLFPSFTDWSCLGEFFRHINFADSILRCGAVFFPLLCFSFVGGA